MQAHVDALQGTQPALAEAAAKALGNAALDDPGACPSQLHRAPSPRRE